MKTRESIIGNEIIQHQKRIDEINDMFDFLELHNLKKEGATFIAFDGGDHKEFIFFSVNYNNLDIHVGYKQEDKTLYHDSEVYSYNFLTKQL